jgi:hypothetical protein
MSTEKSVLYLVDYLSGMDILDGHLLNMEESNNDEKIPQNSKNSSISACLGNAGKQYSGLCSD